MALGEQQWGNWLIVYSKAGWMMVGLFTWVNYLYPIAKTVRHVHLVRGAIEFHFKSFSAVTSAYAAPVRPIVDQLHFF